MHRTIKSGPHHLRDAARIIAVRLVDLRLQHRLHMPRLGTDHWQACFRKPTEKPRPSFQSDPLEAVGGVPQNLQQGLRLARHLHFLHDSASVIHNADTRLLDRYVQSSKMVHAALLLLMLEAVTTDLVSPSASSAAPKNLQLSTSWAGRLPHLSGVARKTFAQTEFF